MHSKILPLAIATFLLFPSCTDLLAQIKIGTNPTTIEPTSNLEVEASTAARKFKIDKTNGKVTLADGTQGNHHVLTSDAEGNATWKKVGQENLSLFLKLMVGGASTGPLVDGERVNLLYPDIQELTGGGSVSIQESGNYRVSAGWYNIETSLTIENSEGCTGSSLMGLEVNLIRNGTVMNSPIIDEKLTPVYQDKYITKVSHIGSLQQGDYVSFSILPTIKFPQAGCVIKVTKGDFKMTYVP